MPSAKDLGFALAQTVESSSGVRQIANQDSPHSAWTRRKPLAWVAIAVTATLLVVAATIWRGRRAPLQPTMQFKVD
jgi:hypothetical protein